MQFTVLGVPDCPHVEVLLDRLRTVLLDRAADVAVIEVADDVLATRWGMTGSPTLLIDGTDPFATAGVAPSVSCRLYRGANGTVDGAPSLAQLRVALNLE